MQESDSRSTGLPGRVQGAAAPDGRPPDIGASPDSASIEAGSNGPGSTVANSSVGNTVDNTVDNTVQRFRQRFGGPPRVVTRAPGRVNLIGEHTDYHHGFVLPMAIDRSVWIAARPRADRRVVLVSTEFGDEVTFELDLLRGRSSDPDVQAHWSQYLAGLCARATGEGLPVSGFEAVIGGDVPVGAGLSSSAALLLAGARMLASFEGWDWDPVAMAVLAQSVEAEWIGVQCGIMDPLVIACADAGSALLIDCANQRRTAIRVAPDVQFVVLDSGTRRQLREGDYNLRRAESERAAAALGVTHLREVGLLELETQAQRLDPLLLKRARHVVNENQRALLAAEALSRRDWRGLGNLFNASHRSLARDYSVSTPELDHLVEIANRHPGCFGARLTGAGFGGCAVALVRRPDVDDFAATTCQAYRRLVGETARAIPTDPSAGASQLAVELE